MGGCGSEDGIAMPVMQHALQRRRFQARLTKSWASMVQRADIGALHVMRHWDRQGQPACMHNVQQQMYRRS